MGIYSKIIDLQKLGFAWEKVKKNRPAAGVDQVTYEEFDERRREELKQLNLELVEYRYESLPVKQVAIYKGEKVRTIALFSMRDKVVQQSIAQELNKIYEPLFSKSTYAYRPGQSALHALDIIEGKVKAATQGKAIWVLKMDIADFFDCILHENLLNTLGKCVREAEVLTLIGRTLKTSILEEHDGTLKENKRGIFQGSSCAPILSNVYLMDYDKEMEKRCGFYLRYSDDILVLEHDETKIKSLYEYTKTYLESKGLKLKESKTLLKRLDEKESFEYLGYSFTTKGKAVPAKAEATLTERLETMWFVSGLSMTEKIKKGQEILGGWEQYYKEEREIGSILEYVIVLSMIRNKDSEIIEEVENQRFGFLNYYRDIAKYMSEYWLDKGNVKYALKEFEQFCQVPEGEEINEKNGGEKLLKELLECYKKLLIEPIEELYTEIMQLYTDMGAYKKAAYFWELRNKIQREEKVIAPSVDMDTEQKIKGVSLADYFDLFVGREDTYAKEILADNRRGSEQVLEPLTEERVREHLEGKSILETYVQRPNHTSKYMVFDIDISKKVLLQVAYGSAEFSGYKQKAANVTAEVCAILKTMGFQGYIEDTGYRGYHVWVFFTEWIPVRYINQLTDYVQSQMKNEGTDIAIEFFPNHSRIKPGKCGQKLKLPLGVHIKTGKNSGFLDKQFVPIEDYKEFLAGIAKYSMATIHKILGAYVLNTTMKKEQKVVDQNLEKLGQLPETVKIVLEKCNLMRYLCQKAESAGYLSHFERLSILHVFGHMGEEGKEFVHTVMGFTLNYQYNVTQKFIMKLPQKPISCAKLREQYKLVTAEYGCSCNFKRTKNCYPSPVLHAIKNSEEEQLEITVPMSRVVTKAKEEKVYEEINIHKQVEQLAQKVVGLKKQKRGLDKSIRKVEMEMQKIFDQAEIDCLEINIGMLVRRKKDTGYEWLIEI